MPLNVTRTVPDPLANHVDDAAPGYFVLKAGREATARRNIVSGAQHLQSIWLRPLEKGDTLRQIDRVLATVVLRVASDPARADRRYPSPTGARPLTIADLPTINRRATAA